jgi:type IV pilus assembly protein PilA
MILKLRERMARDESGFTLVELLVVMLILGLLAAIAIPAFFNQSNKAKDAKAKEAVRTAETAMETYATDHNGHYNGPPAPTAAALRQIEATLNDANLADPTGVTQSSYTVTVTSDTGNTFSITRNSDGTTDLTCTQEDGGNNGEYGCPAGGNWG